MMLAERTGIELLANPHRVMCRLFIPGEEELIRGESRVRGLVQRCLTLEEGTVADVLKATLADFEPRHRDLESTFRLHYAAVSNVAEQADGELSDARKLLIGAYLTQEYAFEATAYCNPSMVMAPDQTGVPPGSIRYVMSIRAVGEGHISSLVFRSGIIGPHGEVTIDDVCPYASTHGRRFSVLRNKLVLQATADDDLDAEDMRFVLGMLPSKFTPEEFVMALSQLHSMRYHEPVADRITEKVLGLAHNCYEVDFEDWTQLAERVLWPVSHSERRGMEDARWVLFHDDNGDAEYRATYTGFDGQAVVSRVLETTDFRTFTSMELTGHAVLNKGVAIFPRKIRGRYVALSRWDRESNSIAYSDDGYFWDESKQLQEAARPWELVHVGNCGSPIETPEGWLVITHGAGPMRTYVLGAVLLDLDDPTIMKAELPYPLLEPNEQERVGYVPNVVYSCGGLIHNEYLILPYGFSDSGTRIARIKVSELLAEMVPVRLAA